MTETSGIKTAIGCVVNDDMDLKDYFAAQALPSCLLFASAALAQGKIKDIDMETVAAYGAYAVAEAMMKERSK